jgi:hypothetical protein
MEHVMGGLLDDHSKGMFRQVLKEVEGLKSNAWKIDSFQLSQVAGI